MTNADSTAQDGPADATPERPAPDLRRLFAMAGDRSPQARRQVASVVGDLYLDPTRVLSDGERAVALDILQHVLHDAEMALRRALAERLAETADAPAALILALANDAIEIARPLLLRSELLSDGDLIAIVRRHATPHQLAIAARRVVNAPVADALVTAGDPDVAHVLLRNRGARLSPRALARIAQAAQHAGSLHEPLLERPELSADLACRLYWVLGLELRRALLQRFGLRHDQLDRALQATLAQLFEETRHRLHLSAEQRILAERLAEGGAITPSVLIQTLRLGRYELFTVLLARLAQLPTELVQHVTTASDGEGLAVVCRALGLDKGSFASIFLLSRGARPGDHVVDPHELSRVLAGFDRLAADAARGIVTGWRTEPGPGRSRVVPFPVPPRPSGP